MPSAASLLQPAVLLFRFWRVLPFCLAVTLAAQTIAPSDGATDVPVNVTLTWPAVDGATGYDVYFGAGAAPAFQCCVTKPTFLLETLSAGKAYRWRVDPVTASGAKAGPVLKFTTSAQADRDAMFAWSIRIANSVRAQFPQPASLRGWNYTEGMTMDALYSIATRTGRTDDFDFIRGWLDRFVAPDGSLDATAYPLKLYSLNRMYLSLALSETANDTGPASREFPRRSP